MSQPLTKAQESLVTLSAALASRDPGSVSMALQEANRSADPVAVEEAILQSYLFLGYPAALNAFAEWRVLTGRPAPPPVEDTEPWSERGARVCKAVYGGQYEDLRDNIRALQADMELWMIDEGYGKVLGRPGLDLPDRELCISALLAVLHVPKQLYSHLRGALNVGASPDAVARVLDLAGRVSDDSASSSAADVWASVQRRNATEEEPCS